jgi:hypothetical protein
MRIPILVIPTPRSLLECASPEGRHLLECRVVWFTFHRITEVPVGALHETSIAVGERSEFLGRIFDAVEIAHRKLQAACEPGIQGITGSIRRLTDGRRSRIWGHS